MYIDKYLKGGLYSSPDGSYQDEDPADFIQSYILGFCVCGRPEDALSLVRDVLRHVANLQDLVWEKQWTFAEWEEAGARIADKRVLYFLYYFLDTKGLTEHGGAVPGWLTTEGRQLLEDLEQLNLEA